MEDAVRLKITRGFDITTIENPSNGFSAYAGAGGTIEQRQKGFFVLRLKIPFGQVNSDQLPQLAEIAERYGRGELHLTTRQSVEIPWIESANVEAAKKAIADIGMAFGASGPRLRVVTACPGSRVCKHGQKDSQGFAKEIDEKFFGTELPHKFKIAVSGCPNSCTKPRENDIGFCGMAEPEISPEECIGCGKCQKLCKEKAITMKGELPSIDTAKCVFCGDCIRGCPVSSLKAKRKGYAVYAGGKMGRHPRLGQLVAEFVSEEEGLSILEQSLELYRLRGAPKERFGDTIQRIGFDTYVSEVINSGHNLWNKCDDKPSLKSK